MSSSTSDYHRQYYMQHRERILENAKKRAKTMTPEEKEKLRMYRKEYAQNHPLSDEQRRKAAERSKAAYRKKASRKKEEKRMTVEMARKYEELSRMTDEETVDKVIGMLETKGYIVLKEQNKKTDK